MVGGVKSINFVLACGIYSVSNENDYCCVQCEVGMTVVARIVFRPVVVGWV